MTRCRDDAFDLRPAVGDLGGARQHAFDALVFSGGLGFHILIKEERAVEFGQDVVGGLSGIGTRLTNEAVLGNDHAAVSKPVGSRSHLGVDIELTSRFSVREELQDLSDPKRLECAL